MLIVSGLISMLSAIFNGMAASVGNLVSLSDKKRILIVFRELFSSRFLMTSTLSFAIFTLADCFMHFWVGDNLYIDKISLFLISLTFFLNTQRSVVDNFISAYGLFKDIWAPIVEAILNIGLSIILGYYFGLPGILSGVIVSHIFIVFCWKPYFLFKEGLRQNLSIYTSMYAKHILLMTICIAITMIVKQYIPIDPLDNVLMFMLYALVLCVLYFVLLFFALYCTEIGMRSIVERFKHN